MPMPISSPDPQARTRPDGNMSSSHSSLDSRNAETPPQRHADLSAWLVWAVLMLIAIAILPFAVHNQDVVRAIARMCGFDFG